ncbi:phage head-tail connector protein, partial [Salmonella enterica subsp. enterica serovar Infantis]
MTLEDIKDHLQIDHDSDDGQLKEKILEASSVLLA